MKKLCRREFLKISGTGLSSMCMPAPLVHLGAAPVAGERILVVIYLRGGQDTLNTVVPYGDPRYYEIRPTIAIPREDSPDVEGVIPLDKRFGLHPALAPLKPLYDQGLFAPIVNVGSPHPTRSHFDAQDFMEYAAPGLRNVRSGWLNRYLQITAEQGRASELRALAMQGLLPRALRGEHPVLAVPDRQRRDSSGLLDAFDELYKDQQQGMAAARQRPRRGEAPRQDPVKMAGRDTIAALRRYQELTIGAPPPQPGVSYPRGAFGDRLRRIAQVIKTGEPIEVACADYVGWDHHAGQGGAQGKMADMLADLAGSLAAFIGDLGPHADRTVVLTMTEFGRTCRENGNAGTDHGHGGLVFALGGPVRGGRIYGTWSGLADKDLYQSRDLQATTDFRDVMAEVLEEHMEVKLPRNFFPDFRPARGPGFIG